MAQEPIVCGKRKRPPDSFSGQEDAALAFTFSLFGQLAGRNQQSAGIDIKDPSG